MAAKPYILNYSWRDANFIIEGHMRAQVVHRCPRLIHLCDPTSHCYDVGKMEKRYHFVQSRKWRYGRSVTREPTENV